MTQARRVLRTLCEVWPQLGKRFRSVHGYYVPKGTGIPDPDDPRYDWLTYDEAVAEAEKVFAQGDTSSVTWSWIADIFSRTRSRDKERFRAWTKSKKAFIDRTGGFA